MIADVIIPAYNESKSIEKVIHAIPKEIIRAIIVCDNGSTDDTAEYARAAGAIVVSAPQRGYGSACLAGMAYVRSQIVHGPPDVVIFLDGDFSDYPEESKLLLDAVKEGADLVIGSRVRGHHDPKSLTIPQQFGNWLATRLIHLFFGFQFTDLGPFRAIRWNKLLELDMQDRNYGWTVEMQVKAVKQGLSCTEVPVSYRKRIGQSKVSGTIKGSVLAGYKILWTIFKSL